MAPYEFKIVSHFKPTGDQPQAIQRIVEGIQKGLNFQTLLGVTGSGKTFTMASIIEKLQRPTLVIAHNKTLAAQLATEFGDFFPNNSVEYFVSYYDYYQPEAYIPRTDTYIEKFVNINEEIDRLRHAATRAILTRRDTLIVASVSCIYGLGAPKEYSGGVIRLQRSQNYNLRDLARYLIKIYYERNDIDMARGRFRISGDTLEIMPSYEEIPVRIQFWGDEIEKIQRIDPLTREVLAEQEFVDIFPARHFVTSKEKLTKAVKDIQKELYQRVNILNEQGKLLESQRLSNRTQYDIEMMQATGICQGIENYSRHMEQRTAGSPPSTLLDYFPKDFLLFIDESHITIPQLRGMYNGDRSRKSVLIEHGFRLPSALDNRPLKFEEFENYIQSSIFVSGTPSEYESIKEQQKVEQIIRPTGIVDPLVKVMPINNQIDDLIERVNKRTKRKERTLITTLTKRMAEELCDYMKELGIKVQYLHSEIHTLDRSEILRDLRLGVYDVLVGINLLREGLDLPEVSLVAILDADKEGYLRSETALIQTMGRAARHPDGLVVMYADRITGSMRRAITITQDRRKIQSNYNKQHGINPSVIIKEVHDITQRIRRGAPSNTKTSYINIEPSAIPNEEVLSLIKELEKQMRKAAKQLEFEKAALIRDQITDIKNSKTKLNLV